MREDWYVVPAQYALRLVPSATPGELDNSSVEARLERLLVLHPNRPSRKLDQIAPSPASTQEGRPNG